MSCNEIVGSQSGLVVEGGSTDMIIETNVFENNGIEDLFVGSNIGLQEHSGNIFSGGAFSDLNNFDFDNFKYDNALNPTFEPNPFTSGFFKYEMDIGSLSQECTSTIGNSVFFYQNNPSALCQLIKRIQNLQNNDTHYNQYWLFMYNLIRHYKLSVSYTQWPECFKSLIMELEDCGLLKLIDNEIAIINRLKFKTAFFSFNINSKF